MISNNAGRDINYNRTSADYAVDVCPCCGKPAKVNAFACMSCCHWYSHLVNIADVLKARDEFYEIGVKLRAEGKLPPLPAKPQTVCSCEENPKAPCLFEDHDKSIWNYWVYATPAWNDSNGGWGWSEDRRRPEMLKLRKSSEEPDRRRSDVRRKSDGPPLDHATRYDHPLTAKAKPPLEPVSPPTSSPAWPKTSSPAWRRFCLQHLAEATLIAELPPSKGLNEFDKPELTRLRRTLQIMWHQTKTADAEAARKEIELESRLQVLLDSVHLDSVDEG